MAAPRNDCIISYQEFEDVRTSNRKAPHSRTPDTASKSFKPLRQGGRQIAIASNPPEVRFNLVEYYHGLKHLIGGDTMSLGGPDIVAFMDQLQHGFESGDLQPPRSKPGPSRMPLTPIRP